MSGRNWRIGTRGSALALWQAHFVKARLLEADPGCAVEIEIIKTSGDRIQDRALLEIGGKGLFVKEIQVALVEGRADLAVHSLKDYPVENPAKLTIGCIPQRQDRRDALVLPHGKPIGALAKEPHVGTGSLRRQHQAKLLHPKWIISPLRGNVDTRIKKADSGQLDAVILAAAGLKRLGYEDRISRVFSAEEMVPAVGQGAIAVECRRDDREMLAVLGKMDDLSAHREISAERLFLEGIGGSCTTPVGINAELAGDQVTVRGFLSTVRGDRHLSDTIAGPADRAEELAKELLERFWSRGAAELLQAE